MGDLPCKIGHVPVRVEVTTHAALRAMQRCPDALVTRRPDVFRDAVAVVAAEAWSKGSYPLSSGTTGRTYAGMVWAFDGLRLLTVVPIRKSGEYRSKEMGRAMEKLRRAGVTRREFEVYLDNYWRVG
jgi:hypothetical protein